MFRAELRVCEPGITNVFFCVASRIMFGLRPTVSAVVSRCGPHLLDCISLFELNKTQGNLLLQHSNI